MPDSLHSSEGPSVPGFPEAGDAGLVDVLLASAEALLTRKAHADAIRCAEQACRLAAASGPRARANLILGKAQFESNDLRRAEPPLRAATRGFDEAGDHERGADALLCLGTLLRRTDRLDEARSCFTESLQRSAVLRPGPLRARALEELGIIARLLGDPGTAVEAFTEARRIHEAVADSAGVGRAASGLGNALAQMGRLEEAIAQFTQALELREAAGHQSDIAAILNNLGSAQLQLGHNEDAERSFVRARGIYEAQGKTEMVANVSNNLGVLGMYLGDAPSAETHLLVALRIREASGNLASQTKIRNNLAQVALMRGQPSDALDHADRSIALLAQLERVDGLGAALFARGRACLALARIADADAARNDLTRLAASGSDPEVACEALLLEADLALARGHPSEAIDRATRALETAGESLGRYAAEALRLRAEGELRCGEADRARETLREAERALKELRTPYYLALCRVTLGRLFEQAGAHEAAAERFRAASQAFARMENRTEEWRSLLALAEAEWSISRAQARSTLEHAAARARELARTDLLAELEALRQDLSARSSAVGNAATILVAAMQSLREAPTVALALEAAVRILRQAFEADAAWHRAAPSVSGGTLRGDDGSEFPALVVSGRSISEAEADPWCERVLRSRRAELWSGPPSQGVAVPVIGSGDFLWGTLALDGVLDANRAAPLLDVAAGVLAFALEARLSRVFSAAPPAEQRRARYGIFGESPALMAVIDTVERVARSESSVLIQGESGTGKELVARALHDGSPRREGPFEAIACPSIPKDLIEAELFGHEKGSFTGADRERPGRIERARGGTLFLDEIGDIDPGTQSKLLRFLQEREFLRVGGREPIHADVRVVAATSRDLEAEIRAGRFREDLYYRLSVVPIAMPALRERGDDVLLLSERFLRELGEKAGRTLAMAPAALEALRRYSWPGNVRELRNLIEYVIAVVPGDRIALADLPEKIREAARSVRSPSPETGLLNPGETLDARLMTLEGQLLRSALERSAWNQSQAARLLGITETKLRHRMRRYGMKGADQPERRRRRRR